MNQTVGDNQGPDHNGWQQDQSISYWILFEYARMRSLS